MFRSSSRLWRGSLASKLWKVRARLLLAGLCFPQCRFARDRTTAPASYTVENCCRSVALQQQAAWKCVLALELSCL